MTALVGAASLIVYALAASLFAEWNRGNFSEAKALAAAPELLGLFVVLFLLYLLSVAVILRAGGSRNLVLLVFGFAVLFRGIALLNPPVVSDDIYRYVWDGRVQAAGISPYTFAPASDELVGLRDAEIWPNINRKQSPTVYPAGAQIAFALLWRCVPDSVLFTRIVMSASGLLAGILVALLLRRLGQSPALAIVFLWNPLVVIETTHSAHVDALVLPLVVGAWLARSSDRDWLAGGLIGIAASVKLYPAFLLAALWRPRDERGSLGSAWRAPLLAALGFGVTYLPYVGGGRDLLGYLPSYFDEWSNASIAWLAWPVGAVVGRPPGQLALLALVASVAAITLVFAVRSPSSPREAIERSAWPIGMYLLLNQNLLAWYVLWLVPLLALRLRTGRLGFRFDAWTGWLLFTCLVVVGYLPDLDWLLFFEYGILLSFLLGPRLLHRAQSWRAR